MKEFIENEIKHFKNKLSKLNERLEQDEKEDIINEVYYERVGLSRGYLITINELFRVLNYLEENEGRE